MSLISLRPITSAPEQFNFRFVVPSDPVSIDFCADSGEQILLHISVRQAANQIVLNSAPAGAWQQEVVVAAKLDEHLAASMDIVVETPELAIYLNGEKLLLTEWREDLTRAAQIVLSDDRMMVTRNRKKRTLVRENAAREQVPVHAGGDAHLDAATLAAALRGAILDDMRVLLDQRLPLQDRRLPEVAAIVHAFADNPELKPHKSVRKQRDYVVAQQDSSTPGLRVRLKPEPQRLGRIVAAKLEGIGTEVGFLLADDSGKIVEKHKFAMPGSATDLAVDVATTTPIAELFVVFFHPAKGHRLRFDTLTLQPPTTRPAAPAIAHRERRAAGVASMPSREAGLAQAVASLAPQFDELHVYLNGYAHIPAFLAGRPEIKIYGSAEFDDRGDAGKFFGLARSNAPLAFTFDDDIVYPADYADRLAEAAARFDGPVGVHGSIFRFPASRYYDQRSRYVLHFRDSNAVDRRVHVLGTGTLAFPRALIAEGFELPYRNMADIWFARRCTERGVAQHAVARAFEWLKPFGSDDDSIFRAHDQRRTAQSLIVEREVAALKERVTTIKSARRKILVGIKTFNRLPYLKECVESLVRTACPEFDLVVAIADDGSSDGTRDYLETLKIPYELHVLLHDRAYASGQTNAIIELFRRVRGDFLIVLDDDVVFKKAGWMSGYFNAAMRSGYHHLCHFNLPHYAQLCAKRGTAFPPPAREHSAHPLVAFGDVESCMGALFTFTPDVLDAIGWADETNFFVRGLWHIDLSARACRAGFNEYARFFDLKDSNQFLELQNTLKEEYRTSIAWESDDFKRASTKEERERRWSVVRLGDRIAVSHAQRRGGEPIRRFTPPSAIAVNDVFDRVFVINLDRRPDRMAAIAGRLQRAGIAFERVPAVDGKAPEIQAEFADYVAARRAAKLDGRELSSKAFVLGYRSDAERVAHLERKLGGPAIRSAGAWSYSKTYQRILMDCLEAGHERVLVLDDDGLLHRDCATLFDRAVRQLPRDWKILQLGTLQYDWDWTRPYSENLYLPDGVVVGSHAVGFHRDVIATLLEAVERWTLPYDVGPLHYACRAFREKSFVIQPNLVIQDSSESDISSSDVALAEGMSETNVYRWKLSDYA